MSKTEKQTVPKYCYTAASHTEPDTPISDFYIKRSDHLTSLCLAWRIPMPKDIILTDSDMPRAFKTKDTRTLRELGAMPIVRTNGTWRKAPYLAELPINDWEKELLRRGYRFDDEAMSYLQKGWIFDEEEGTYVQKRHYY